jgi:hypothetical protein
MCSFFACGFCRVTVAAPYCSLHAHYRLRYSCIAHPYVMRILVEYASEIYAMAVSSIVQVCNVGEGVSPQTYTHSNAPQIRSCHHLLTGMVSVFPHCQENTAQYTAII